MMSEPSVNRACTRCGYPVESHPVQLGNNEVCRLPVLPALSDSVERDVTGKVWSVIRRWMRDAARAEREEKTTERFEAVLDALASQCEKEIRVLYPAPHREGGSGEVTEAMKFAIYDPHWPDSDGITSDCVWCGQQWPCAEAERAERQFQRVLAALSRGREG